MIVAEAAVRAESSNPEAVDLGRLLRPRSIAIVGAQPERTSIGGGVLSNLEMFGYTGEIHLVSRSRDEIRGRACVKSIADLPAGIDVAVLIVPQAAIMESVRACIERRIGAVVVYTSGFAEADENGRRQQEELATLCREAGIALLGPNCMGYTNYIDGIPLTFEPVDVRRITREDGRVAIVAQSGATAANIRFAMHARAIDASYVIATGNEATLGAEHFIDFLLDDPLNAAIGVYVEQIRNPAFFLETARRARRQGVPIVLLHPGSSERGRAAAQSHTGALAGDHAVMQTILRSEAVALVDTTDEMFDVLAILSRFPAPKPGKAGIVTNSGAIRGLCFDFSEGIGLELATHSPEIEAEMQALVPPYVHVDNPFDVGTTGFANPGIFGSSLAVMLKEPDVGMVLQSHAGGSPKMQVAKSDAILPVFATSEKPVILNIIGDDYPLDEKFMADVRAAGIPFFRSPERALRAMAAVAAYADALAEVAEAKPAAAPTAKIAGHGTIPEYEGKRVLADLGIRVPRGGMAGSVDEALGVALGIGYPVVIKAQAAALAHKSDAGGVIVDIADAAALRGAWEKLHANVAAAKPGLALYGVLVEEMAKSGLEMVVGAKRDPQWGPVVLVGLGGVWIEALSDARLLPAGAGRARVLTELKRLKAAKLLGPFRGQPARDIDAVADVVIRLGELMLADPAIREVDINPLVVGAAGEGAVALDALFVRD